MKKIANTIVAPLSNAGFWPVETNVFLPADGRTKIGFPRWTFVLVAFLGLALSTVIPARGQVNQTILNSISTGTFTHQAALNTNADITYIKAQIAAGAEPWVTAYSKLSTSPWASLTAKPNSFATTTLTTNGGNVWQGIDGKPDVGGIALITDAQVAYAQALMYEFTGTQTYATNAVNIMNAWSANLKVIGGANWYLVEGWSGSVFPLAAEMLRNNSAFTSADQAQFTKMLNAVYLPYLNERIAYGNREFACCDAMCAIGVFNNDRAAFYEGIRHWMSYIPGYIYMTSDGSLPNTANYWMTTGTTNPEPTPSQYTAMDSNLFPNPTPSNCWILASNAYPGSFVLTGTQTVDQVDGGPYGDDKTEMTNAYNDPAADLPGLWWTGSNPNGPPSGWQTLPYFQGQAEETVSRDLGHVELAMSEIFAVAEMARVQGYDLYSGSSSRLAAFLETDSSLRLGHAVPDGITTIYQDTSLAATFENGYNHLVNVLGLSLPNTEQLINPLIRSEQSEVVYFDGRYDYWHHIFPAPPGITADNLPGASTYAGGWETLTHGNLNGPSPGPDPNLALNQPTTVSSGAGAGAVDGNYGTNWASAHNSNLNTPGWIYVDLGSVYNVTGVNLIWGEYNATAYNVQVSNDAVNWTTVSTGSATPYDVQELSVSGTGRYVRLYCSQAASVDAYALSELEVYGSSAIPTTGLVAYYPFDQNANDASGNGNNGTATTGVTYSTSVPNSESSYSAQFNGTGGQIDVPNSTSLEITGSMTLACWVNPTSVSADEDIISKSDNTGYRFRLTPGGEPELILGNSSGGDAQLFSTQTVPTGVWTHLATTVSFSGSTVTVQFYVNGVPDKSAHTASLSAIEAGTGELVIGARVTGDSEPWPGGLDQVLIYNVDLTAAQIQQLANP